MSAPEIKAALYCRISQDPRDTGLGVERQQQDCEAYCRERGWQVVRVFVDNDISAYSGKRRPGYEGLLEAIKDGSVDKVVAYHTDRLHRRLRELVEYCDVITATNVMTHTVKAGDIDLSTPSGVMIAQIKGAVDEAYVSEAKEKNRRARRQIAEKGLRHMNRRVYGWEDDGVAVREEEAQVVREIIRRVLDGQSPTSIALDLNRRQIPTNTGKQWTGIGVRKCAARPSNAAIREHRGQLYYNGQWEPIITRAEHEQVLLALRNNTSLRYQRGSGRKYLLTGFAVCGQCGARLSPTVGGTKAKPAYRCPSRRSNESTRLGCGKVSRGQVPLDDLVTRAVLYRLDTDALSVAVGEHGHNQEEITRLLARRTEQQELVDRIVDAFSSGTLKMTVEQFNRATARAGRELEAIEQQLKKLTFRHMLSAVDTTKSLAQAWADAPLSWRRNLVELVVDTVVVHRRPQQFSVVWYEVDGQRYRFDPALVEIRWKA